VSRDAESLPEHVVENRRLWDEMAHEWVEGGERAWDPDTPATWGVWRVPDAQLRLLPEDMSGMHAVDLGCGTGYFAARMARRGATRACP